MEPMQDSHADFFANGSEAQYLRYINGIYYYMSYALLLTFGIMYAAINWQPLLDVLYYYSGNEIIHIRPLAWLLLFLPIGLAVLIKGHLARISYLYAHAAFWLYAVAMGLALSVLFNVTVGATASVALLATAGLFAGFALYGSIIKKDMTTLDQMLPIALAIVLITLVINVYANNPVTYMVLGIAAMVLFIVLVVYNASCLRNAYRRASQEGNAQHLAIWGALLLYTNIINIIPKMVTSDWVKRSKSNHPL